MASTVGPPPPPSDHRHGLSLESLPTVDLRLLSQSELTALSLCSSHSVDLRRCDDVVIPKIDRTVFNESAGSRKQTFSKLRLAPRKTAAHLHNHHRDNDLDDSKPRASPSSAAAAVSPVDADNTRIIALFKALFNNEAVPPVTTGMSTAMITALNTDDEESLIPVNVEYSDAFFNDPDRKRKRADDFYFNVDVDVNVDFDVDANGVLDVNVVDVEAQEREKEEREKELVNKNGEVVDLKELAKKDDPYGEEIRRRTEGKESAEELLGFITDLEGQWGSRRKKRKIVDANVFGDCLPNGWKVLIAMKKKLGRAWVFVRRYISPSGRYFVSCKDVSSYLISLTSPEDIKQQPTVEGMENAIADNKLTPAIAKDLGTNVEDTSLIVTTECNDAENVQNSLSTSENIDHGRQLLVVSNASPGGQAASALKCHKCSTGFNEKDELLNHLLSCHKRKRRKAGEPIEDDIIMKDGKYECQFCNKVFHERSSYFGHVGIHVKNYVKSIGGSSGLTVGTKQKDFALTVPEVPLSVSEIVRDEALNANSVPSVPNMLVSGDLNFTSAGSKPGAGCEAQPPLENGEVGQNNVELSMETAQSNKIPADESAGKLDETTLTIVNIAREVEEAVDDFAMKTDMCSVSVENNNENNELCESLGEIHAIDHINSEVIKASPNLVENDEVEFISDSKQAGLGNHGNVAVNILQSDREASESDLLCGNKETSSGDLNSDDRSLVNNTVKKSCFAEDLELGDDNDGLMDGSDSGQLDMGVDAGQCTGSLDETSDILHVEEDAFGITAKRVEFMESQLAESKENSSCSPSGDQPITETQDEDFLGIASVALVGTCSLEDSEAIVDADISIAQEQPEASVSLQSKGDGCGYVVNEVDTIGHLKLVEPGDTGGFEVEQTCSLVNSSREISNRESEEPKSDQVMNPNLLFAPESNGRHLTADVIASNDQSHGDVSKLLGAFSNFVEDKPEEDPKSFLSVLSLNQHMHDVGLNNMTDASTTTNPMQLPELDKVDRMRTNKLIFDFGSITDINSRFLGSVQNETIPEGTSPFSLWGQQTCIIEDNQNRVFDSARGAAQQERLADSNSLNLFGLQQPSVVEHNLNKVCVNEQGYGAQHNESEVNRKNNDIGREGIYGSARGLIQQERASDNNSLNLDGFQQPPDAGFNLNKVHMNKNSYDVQRSNENEARTERISHGNTINLAGFQQQCDTGYNLNKSCMNQQSYGVQCNEAGAYSRTDESKQERVNYGNSLSLASVPRTCEARYSMNKACIPQTCDLGFGLNKGFMGTMQGLSKLDEVGYSRDQDLMVGFGNSGGRPNQNVTNGFLWRAAEGNILPGGLMDTSTSRGQSSGSYQAFDFLSDKGGNDMYAANEKFDNISNFEGLRPNNVEPMEISFMTTQDSSSQLGHKNVLPFNPQINQGFGSAVWHQKPTLPNMMAGHVRTMCVWCGNEFHQDSLSCEVQSGSIGYLCPTCKARMSGQFL